MTTLENQTPDPTSFRVSSAHFLSITAPHPDRDRYGLAFPWQDVPARLAGVFSSHIQRAQRSKWGLVNLATGVPPRVHGTSLDNADMVQFRQQIHSLNIALERALVGKALDVFVDFYSFTPTPGRHQSEAPGPQIGVNLVSIRFDPAAIALPGFEEVQGLPDLRAGP